MVTTIGVAIRRLVAAMLGHSYNRTGYANHQKFEVTLAHYRSLGAKIGKKVRLLGRIDDINPHLVTIGDYSVIGVQAALLAHCPIKGPLPVSIGSFSYVAFGALILPGVTLGDHCMVGAGAVVTESMPMGSVIAGNPARVVRPLTSEEIDRIKTAMLEDKIFAWDSNRPA